MVLGIALPHGSGVVYVEPSYSVLCPVADHAHNEPPKDQLVVGPDLVRLGHIPPLLTNFLVLAII